MQVKGGYRGEVRDLSVCGAGGDWYGLRGVCGGRGQGQGRAGGDEALRCPAGGGSLDGDQGVSDIAAAQGFRGVAGGAESAWEVSTVLRQRHRAGGSDEGRNGDREGELHGGEL